MGLSNDPPFEFLFSTGSQKPSVTSVPGQTTPNPTRPAHGKPNKPTSPVPGNQELHSNADACWVGLLLSPLLSVHVMGNSRFWND